jgi:hypothetical protein
MKCYSLISTQKGELLFNHIVFDRNARSCGGFNVGKDFFAVNPSSLSDMVTKTVVIRDGSKRQALMEFDLEKSPQRIIEKSHNWDGHHEDDPYLSVLFVQGPKKEHLQNPRRTGVSVRGPKGRVFWAAWSAAERLGDKERTADLKAALRGEHPDNPNVEDYGCRVVLPSDWGESEKKTNYSSYLITFTANAAIELIYARQGKLPNAYIIECDENGELKKINPRKEYGPPQQT